tara:strand:- start:921 stop:1037 length:117 start_codon:yes stop_codon:yes gene_type:complete
MDGKERSAISTGTSKNIGRHGGNTFNVAAPRESRAKEV